MKMSIYITIGKWNEAMKIEFYMLDSLMWGRGDSQQQNLHNRFYFLKNGES